MFRILRSVSNFLTATIKKLFSLSKCTRDEKKAENVHEIKSGKLVLTIEDVRDMYVEQMRNYCCPYGRTYFYAYYVRRFISRPGMPEYGVTLECWRHALINGYIKYISTATLSVCDVHTSTATCMFDLTLTIRVKSCSIAPTKELLYSTL